MKTRRSAQLFRRAKKVIPGGVNSPVRAFGSVGGTPRFVVRGKGARVWDADGNEYLDYVGSWGPLVLGHAHHKVLRAARDAMARGTSFGAPTELEVELAELVCRAVPSIERLRTVSSGTEAAMSTVRLARAVTGRERILKFEGGYHGHADGLLLGAGSGVATLGIPGSPGVPRAFAELALQAPYNDLAAVEALFGRYGAELACVLVEPVAGNMGCVLPEPGFLEGLRELCDRHGTLLVFDEVITGFRVDHGGAQARYGVRPDLTILGKIVGGGFPAAAFGGPGELMDRLAPDGPVYQAGTLSGNPLAMAAGVATLRELSKRGVYERLESLSRRLVGGLAEEAAKLGVELTTTHAGGLFGFFFHPGPVRSYSDVKKANGERFCRFFHSMLDDGIWLAPSAFEAGFVSLAHRDADLDTTLAAARRALRRAARGRGRHATVR
jgi:glutamate-1-semialdehyde 2,1-aminomutase